MFDWVKRLMGGDDDRLSAQEIARRRAARRKPSAARDIKPTGPAALPQVTGEGNSQDDWSEWESSMMELDSQLLDLPESARVYEKEASNRYTRPAPLDDDTDTFGAVGKNRDI
jgi:hypothetical protein